MISCDSCMKDIGSEEEPMFVTKDDSIVCRGCYAEIEGKPPDESEGEVDVDEVPICPDCGRKHLKTDVCWANNGRSK